MSHELFVGWLYNSFEVSLLYVGQYDLYLSFFLSISVLFLCLLILSSTIFIGILLLLVLFVIQILLLFFSGQHLFALFLLGVYVGAILVFFIFVVMSFIFFGKSYKLGSRLWLIYLLLPCTYGIYMYMLTSVPGFGSSFYTDNSYAVYSWSFDELQAVGILLFDIDMMYIVAVISLLLLVALIGSITFNASSLVRHISSFYFRG